MLLDATVVNAAIGNTLIGDIVRPVVTVVLGGVLTAACLKMLRRPRQIAHFLDDVMGEDARPGVPPRPGLMERVGTLEDVAKFNATAVAEAHAAAAEARTHAAAAKEAAEKNAVANGAIAAQLEVIVQSVAQLQPNKGSTMFDRLGRIEKDTATVVGRPVQAPPIDHHPHPGGTP